MVDNLHSRILRAAARVYARCGWRGATTRRIAEEASVNEVTLFRHFGSKDALLDTMMREVSGLEAVNAFPAVPVDPEAELLRWIHAKHDHIASRRALVQQMMSDALERPEMARCAFVAPNRTAQSLREYVEALRQHGLMPGGEGLSDADIAAAVTMLMGALFSDAMNREMMPELFLYPVNESLQSYLHVFLRGLGVRVSSPTEPDAPSVRRGARPLTTSPVSG